MIPLPNLHVQDYAKLRSELVEAIPQLSPNWTNFNASDPGITFVELLAWVADTQLFRINELTEGYYEQLLELLAGAAGDEVSALLQTLRSQIISDEFSPTTLYLDPDYIRLLEFLQGIQAGSRPDRAEMARAAAEFRKKRFRAVTQGDFERLAVQATEPVDDPMFRVARAVARDVNESVELAILSAYQQAYLSTYSDLSAASGAIRLIVERDQTQDEAVAKAYSSLAQEVGRFLAPRVLAGVRYYANPAARTPVFLKASICTDFDARPQTVLERVRDRLLKYFNPSPGAGLTSASWIYNEPIRASTVGNIIEETPGVRSLQGLHISVGSIQVAVFSTVGRDTILGPIPEGGVFRVQGFPLVEEMELTALQRGEPAPKPGNTGEASFSLWT